MAIKQASQLEMAQTLLQVMHISSVVILSYLDADFEQQCSQKKFTCVCLLLLLLAAAKMWSLP